MTARRRPTSILFASLCVTALVGGCGDATDAAASRPLWVSPPPPAASVSPAVAPSPAPVPSAAAELTLAFGGDVHFTGRTAALLRDPAGAFGPVAEVLSAADLAVVNLETAITERGTPEPKTYVFRAPATAYEALRGAGIDAVSLANNHALDYGRIGLTDTLDSAEKAGFPTFGAGRDIKQAYAPHIVEVRGTRIALLGFSQIRDLAANWAAGDNRSGIAMAWDSDRALAAVAEARQRADLVIVFNHWGQEGDSCPSADQKRFAGKLADAGVDLIIGAHAHVLQGDGWLGKTYVAYGLGNFLWYGTSRSTETGVLRLTTRGRTVLKSELVPAVVSATGQPVPLTGAAANRVSDRFASLRRCAGLTDRPS